MAAHTGNIKTDKEVVKQLVALLKGGNAHATFSDAIAGLPAKLRSVVPEGLPYSIWQLVEHIRIVQWDVLEFSKDPKHVSPKWPAGYWPEKPVPKDDAAWKNSVGQIKTDLKEFIALISANDADLYAPFPYGEGQNLLREAMLIADHTSYHTGEIIMIRRLLKAWK